MSHMFPDVDRTWNPYPGCRHGCVYCYARDIALKGQAAGQEKYKNGFEPVFIESEARRSFRKGTIFAGSMGDLGGRWVRREELAAIMRVMRHSPHVTFLVLTKDPQHLMEILPVSDWPLPNVVIGTTLETNRELPPGLTRAPAIGARWRGMMELPKTWRRFVSLEPLMDFDLETLVGMVQSLNPLYVYVGLDNHGHHLAEPPLEKTMALIALLEKFIEVRPKTLREAWDREVKP